MKCDQKNPNTSSRPKKGSANGMIIVGGEQYKVSHVCKRIRSKLGLKVPVQASRDGTGIRFHCKGTSLAVLTLDGIEMLGTGEILKLKRSPLAQWHSLETIETSMDAFEVPYDDGAIDDFVNCVGEDTTGGSFSSVIFKDGKGGALHVTRWNDDVISLPIDGVEIGDIVHHNRGTPIVEMEKVPEGKEVQFALMDEHSTRMAERRQRRAPKPYYGNGWAAQERAAEPARPVKGYAFGTSGEYLGTTTWTGEPQCTLADAAKCLTASAFRAARSSRKAAVAPGHGLHAVVTREMGAARLESVDAFKSAEFGDGALPAVPASGTRSPEYEPGVAGRSRRREVGMRGRGQRVPTGKSWGDSVRGADCVGRPDGIAARAGRRSSPSPEPQDSLTFGEQIREVEEADLPRLKRIIGTIKGELDGLRSHPNPDSVRESVGTKRKILSRAREMALYGGGANYRAALQYVKGNRLGEKYWWGEDSYPETNNALIGSAEVVGMIRSATPEMADAFLRAVKDFASELETCRPFPGRSKLLAEQRTRLEVANVILASRAGKGGAPSPSRV